MSTATATCPRCSYTATGEHPVPLMAARRADRALDRHIAQAHPALAQKMKGTRP